ncbi:MAG: Fe-S cluster assembly protein SufB [Bacilli bacterium]
MTATRIIEKGLNEDKVKEISQIKKEPEWMKNFRIDSYHKFLDAKEVNFGPKIDLDFDKLTYYKRVNETIENSWNDIPNDIRDTFDKIGIPKAEQEYLAGVGVQYESEVIYHNMMKELEDKNVIFVDTDTALKKYPNLFKKYFNKLVKNDDNKFASLNGAVWSGGTFIYIPPNTKLDRPLQSYFRINTKDMGQFERTIIVVDENSDLHYIEGCTAPIYSTDSLHAAVVEIFVEKNAKCRYTTIQNWSNNVYNLVTKRAIVEEGATMQWVDGNIGSKVTMKYPACILKGDNSKGSCITIALADKGQIQDTGAKMIHLGKNTKSSILSKSIARNGGNASYRGTVKITSTASNSFSNVKCDTIILDDLSKSDTFPTNICKSDTSSIEHEATVSKINPDQLFYLMTRGINEDQATELLILGFLEAFREELPLEYAVELNNLLKNKIPKRCS